MADEADMSDERIQLAIDQGIIQARRTTALKPKGSCHYCDGPTPALYCNAECREDHEVEQAQLKRLGRG